MSDPTLIRDTLVHIEALNALLAALRVGRRTPEKALNALDKTANIHRRLTDALAEETAPPSDPAAPLREALTFEGFSATNRDRCESPDGFGHPVSGWSISDWMLAATGEFGEAANVAKKLNRVRDGIPGNTRTPDELLADLADEFADAVIYLDLAAQSQGIDLGAAIVSKFNRTSEKIGAPHRLTALATPAPEETDR